MANHNVFREDHIRSPLAHSWFLYQQNTIGMVALWALIFILILTVIGPWIAPYPMDHKDVSALLKAPSWVEHGEVHFFLGTDDLGRDLLSQIIYGAQLTFGGAFLTVFLALVIGSVIGIIGGMSSGMQASVLHHFLDTLLSIPSLLLAIIIISVLGPGYFNTLLAVFLALLPLFTRAVYRAVHDELNKEYIIALRLDGATPLRILRYGILPNIVETFVSQTTRALTSAILDITALGFLGLGAQRPLPEWGTMLSDTMELVFLAPWTVTLPGLAILITILIINIVGEGLRQAILKGMD
ncbi:MULTISPECIES: ABC transporter permease subunit [unclassified Motilimonas]|uniref:ABC transporter permease subunit n=1 Tax=Motilimonas TaxID=1914248 RepID=UPI001E316C59|nr:MULTISPECIES: ABC transporter permease subunit [unclassified Motilimonas]MCE0557595.1 ABC transporter permease subunit [Motilimonas sp. E26]MDO6526272.1 ABC transporter permease subunit [Motilimonas sp. 1_MG-2023]